MNTNGRSAQAYYISTRDNARAAYWSRVFGVTRLPVLSPRPRWQVLADGRETFAYDLKLSDLSQNQVNRFAAVIAARRGIHYEAARRDLLGMASWPVTAIGCTVEVEELAESEEATAEKRPSLLRRVGGVAMSHSDNRVVAYKSGPVKKNFRFFRFLTKHA